MTEKPLYYPKCVFDRASDDERLGIVAENQAALDHEAAELVDLIADCPRMAWTDLVAVRKMRQTLRSVSDYLRGRGNG